MDPPLRFAMVTTFYPPYSFGGDGIFVHRLANELARRGHHVTLIHSADAYSFLAGREPAGSYDDHPNITVHALRSGFSPLSLLVSHQTGRPALYAAELRRLLGDDFDVIHYHNVSLVGGPGVLAMGRALKLYTMHEYWLGCPTHALFRFNRAPCAARFCALCSLSYGRPPQWWRYTGILEAAVRQVDLFLAPSRFLEKKHSAAWPQTEKSEARSQNVGHSGLALREPSLTPGRRRVPGVYGGLGDLPHLAASPRPKREIVAARKETKI